MWHDFRFSLLCPLAGLRWKLWLGLGLCLFYLSGLVELVRLWGVLRWKVYNFKRLSALQLCLRPFVLGLLDCVGLLGVRLCLVDFVGGVKLFGVGRLGRLDLLGLSSLCLCPFDLVLLARLGLSLLDILNLLKPLGLVGPVGLVGPQGLLDLMGPTGLSGSRSS